MFYRRTTGRNAFLCLLWAIALLFLAFPTEAPAAERFTYDIDNIHTCKGGGECVTRFPAVTDNNGEGPVNVGGTPLSNPYDPSACPPKPSNPTSPGAYASIGYDPDNPANALKYNVTKIAPIKGWPKESHLLFDDKLRAWRDSVLVRGQKAGAKTVEADNSDNEYVSMQQKAAQLNHECAMHKRLGQVCPLKNNFEVLGLLDHTPTYWFIETGEGNEGTKHIQEAKSSKVAPNDVYLIHYGPVSQEVCNMIPGSHVLFVANKNLKSSNFSFCPNAPQGAPAAPPAPTQASNTCQKKQDPPPEDNEPPPPPAAVAQQPTQYPESGASSVPPSSPASAPPPRARSQLGPTTNYPVASHKFSGKEDVEDPSTITSRGHDSLSRRGGQKIDRPLDPSQITSRGNFSSAGSGLGEESSGGKEKLGPARVNRNGNMVFASAFVGDGKPGGSDSATAPENSPAAGAKKPAPANANEIIGAFAGKAMDAPKGVVAGPGFEPASKELLGDILPGSGRGPASLQAKADEEANDLFLRVHNAHIRCLYGGRLQTLFH